jgi:flagellin
MREKFLTKKWRSIMGLRISTNMASINAQRSLGSTQKVINKSFAQLSSGSRINQAADDAAGLSISEGFKSQIRSFRQASRNANDGVSLLQVAEGGLNETSNIITRLRELGIQSASDTVSDVERGMINKEVQQLTAEVERISQTCTFGHTKLLTGEASSFDFQVGNNNEADVDRISFDPSQLNATASNLDVDGIDFSSKDGARDALEKLDAAQVKVNGYRADIGAVENRMYSTINNLAASDENLSAANSRIRDADIAQSTADLATNNILLNASTTVLSQANTQPALALKLLS